MKRTALLLFLLAASLRGDNDFHVDLTLHAGANDAKPAAHAPAIIQVGNGGRVIFRGPVQGNFRIIGRAGNVIFQNADTTLPAPTTEEPTLRWKDGENLPGALDAASASDLTWKSPLFADPLQIRWDVINRIDWPSESEVPTDPFNIALRDGSFIYGDITAIGPDTVSIRSTRHGNAVLKRDEILSIRRRNSKDQIYAGPTGDTGWQAMINQQDGSVLHSPASADAVSPMVTGPGGALLIRSWNRSATLDIGLPSTTEVTFQLHSSRRPEFCVAFGGNVRDPLRIETWDNVLVLACQDQFKIIRRIQDNEREIALRVFWDSGHHTCLVYDFTGALITTWNLTGDASSGPAGFILQNRGLDLSLDSLSIRPWDGKTPGKFDLQLAHVELADGRTLTGAIQGGAAGSLTVQPPGQPAVNVTLPEVDAIIFSSALAAVPPNTPCLTFNDDTLLVGHFISLTANHAALATSFTSQPLAVDMISPRQLLAAYTDFASPPDGASPAPSNPPSTPTLDNLDQISLNTTTLHGTLAGTGDGSLGWLPVGAVKPARPAPDVTCEITRAVLKNAPLPADPALFYLDSGDILPGALGTLDRSGADFTSSIMDARKLSAAQIEAIEFSPSTLLNVQGFGDSAWKILKGDSSGVHRAANAVTLDSGTSLGLDSLMQFGEFSFKYDSSHFSTLRVRLFCGGQDNSSATTVLLCSSGAQFTAGQESVPGQFDSQYQVRTQPGAPVNVRFKVKDNAVELFVNDISAGQFPVDPANCAGSGVILEPASVWGNAVFPVTLTDFTARAAVGRTWLPVVAADIRKQVLTVPRFEKNDPPHHLLLAANGDVLRGEIEAATDSHFDFRCGLEKLTVPRERVRAVVWLQPPVKNAADPNAVTPPSAGDQAPTDPLQDRLQARVNFRQIDLAGVLNFLRSQDHSLKIESPDEANSQRVESIQLGSQTISDALTQICAHFNLHYRLDPDDTIVLELPTSSSSGGLVSKTYWLKPNALPNTGTARDLLAANGLSFPKDSSVDWRPESGVLTMVNTDVNHAKLANLLAANYGGSSGSPTHWIGLNGGGQIALAVDKFGPDFIQGHHPFFGAIKLPLAQIATIRTTAPEPSNASRELENWRLVDAPEPVLPTAGGDNYPLLRKDAPGFSLPGLDGSDFDLASEKGQIVVLDFWATWCAPCIKSLPALVNLVSAFPADKVKLIGVDQGEAADQVKHFLETRGLKLNVVLDPDQVVGHKYAADTFPQTVIIAPDGKVAWAQTGYDPDSDGGAAEVIRKLLDPAAPGVTPVSPPAQ